MAILFTGLLNNNTGRSVKCCVILLITRLSYVIDTVVIQAGIMKSPNLHGCKIQPDDCVLLVLFTGEIVYNQQDCVFKYDRLWRECGALCGRGNTVGVITDYTSRMSGFIVCV